MVGAGHHGSHAEGAPTSVDDRGAGRLEGDRQGEQRACGSGAASDGAACGGRRGAVLGGGARGRLSEPGGGDVSGEAVQPGRAGGARDRVWAGTAAELRRGGPGTDRGDGPAVTGSEGRRDRDVVALDPGADGPSGGAPARGRDDDPAGAARRGQFLPEDADVVSDGDGPAETEGRGGPGGRSEDGRKKGAIELAYRLAEAAGVPVWCQDEAGPYQAIPQPGAGWAPVGEPPRQPHEYVRGGTAKLLTLFHPATGEVRAKGVPRAPNAVLHPLLQHELLQVLKELPEVSVDDADLPRAAQWATWLGHVPHLPLPPLRLILVWDNLAGHLSTSIVTWLFAHGVMPLYTPLSGSWLNMAESVQRIICGRALRGQHPNTVKELITWLEDTVAGWNANPTPFVWDGKRMERRLRAKQRHLGGSAAFLQHQFIAA